MKKEELDKLLQSKAGIRLDIGCGASKHDGFVGIDMMDLPGVDIVHDLEETPWPLPNECAISAVASHILEHINPHKGVFINVMDEIWRVLKPHGQLAFVVPYAGTHGYYQDPTHVNPINESTMMYFDPLHPSGLYQFYRPKPWKIQMMAMDRANGFLECVMQKREDLLEYQNVKKPNTIVGEFQVRELRMK